MALVPSIYNNILGKICISRPDTEFSIYSTSTECSTTSSTVSYAAFTISNLEVLKNKLQLNYLSSGYYISLPTGSNDSTYAGIDSNILGYSDYNSGSIWRTVSSNSSFFVPPITLDIDGNYINGYENTAQKIKNDLKRSKLRLNLTPVVKSRSTPIGTSLKDNERKAIETLREEITEKELRKYLRYGFVLVQGKSGKTYQIFRNAYHTKVWLGGKLVEEVCVRLSSDSMVPPTDNIIAFKRMIETDEDEFRKCGNVYNMAKKAA